MTGSAVPPSCAIRPKSSHFRLPCYLCSECHKRDVWLCLFMMSILSSSGCANAAPSRTWIRELQRTLNRIHPDLVKSDASLYAPTLDEIPENCKYVSFLCYMHELLVIIIEEELSEEGDAIYSLIDSLRSQGSSVSCPPCEAHTLEPATKFLQNLKELLQNINSK